MSEISAQTSPVSAQEQVIAYLTGIIQSRAITCAVQLGIADALADGPLHVEEIASRTGVEPSNLFRLLRALESIGIFRETSAKVFENNPLSNCLQRNAPGSLWPLVRIWAPGWVYWDGMTEM